jgi:NitT/TauT family transport system permease protein
MKKAKFSLSPGTWTLLVLVLCVLAWEWAGRRGYLNLYFFSRPSLVWQEFLDMLQRGLLKRHLLVTVKEAGLGLIIGLVLGTAAGLALGVHPKLSRALMPLMTGLNGVPKLALGPLIILWFGIGLRSKVVIAGLMVFFAFFFNLYAGTRSVDRSMIRGVRLLGATRGQILRKVIFPACLPWFLASLRTGLGLALSGAIVGEYLGAGQGLGWVISNAGNRYDAEQMLCCLLVVVVLVVLLDVVVRLLEGKLLRWQKEE